MKPTGRAGSRRPAAYSKPHGSLLEQVLSRENMLRAWKRVKANRGAAGVDMMPVEAFPEFARHNWERIRSDLMKGSYRPMPVRRVVIPKRMGGRRPLGIPTVTDRVIQQAIAQMIGSIFEPIFSEHSFGFRPGKSAHDAIRAVRETYRAGYRLAVDADLSRFFDSVNHDVLMRLLAHRIGDRRILRLIGRYLRAGVSVEGRVEPTIQGVPQGGPLSPLLSNVVLHQLDRELEGRGHRFARYADDFLILVRSQRAGERVMASVTRFLGKRLKLVVNPQKSKVAPLSECRFLGFRIVNGRIRWAKEAEIELKRRLKLITSRSWGVSMSFRMQKLQEYLRGWTGYFGISEYYRPVPVLDEWIRRRIRLCYWKMWKKPRRRMRELMKLGTGRREAVLAGRSRKGPWTLSRTLATQAGMTNDWLTAQGVPSIRRQWIAIHYPSD